MCPLSPYSTPSSNIESPANRQTSKKTRARYSTKMSRDENNLLIFGYYLLMFTNNKTHPQKNNYMYIIYIYKYLDVCVAGLCDWIDLVIHL